MNTCAKHFMLLFMSSVSLVCDVTISLEMDLYWEEFRLFMLWSSVFKELKFSCSLAISFCSPEMLSISVCGDNGFGELGLTLFYSISVTIFHHI